MNLKQHKKWFSQRLLSRFIRYVKIETTSDKNSKTSPTTRGQLRLAKKLLTEFNALKINKVTFDENGFVYACLESNMEQETEPLAFIAHLDTSSDVSGKDVFPLLHKQYTGKPLKLKQGIVIAPEEFPDLLNYKGGTIITAEGTTLLGADDKAGIAEIMTALDFFVKHPRIKHGKIEVVFTPDEETGRGMSKFPYKKLESKYCFTVDGGKEGTIETECFEAYKVKVVIRGKSIHLGEARAKLINAVELASQFVQMLPKNETPQTTDGRYGYYCPVDIRGQLENAYVEVLIRDFEEAVCKRRIEAIKALANAIEKTNPGSKIDIEVNKQYENMAKYLKAVPHVITLLEQAVRKTGIEPVKKIIRGGTDGARLCERGFPTPNIFTGGHNFHAKQEWIALEAMVRATETLINLVSLWAQY